MKWLRNLIEKMPAEKEMRKKKNSLSKLSLLLFCSCTHLPTVYIPPQLRNFTSEEKKSPPHLTISILPKTFLSGSFVSAVIKIKGGPISETFYCQTITWNWGDGETSSETEDCEPFEESQQLRTLFTKIHQYRSAGEFKITFTLGKHSVSDIVNVLGI